MGSSVILPIITSIAAAIIYDWAKKKDENNTLDDVVVKFVFRINGSNKEYIFAGSVSQLVKFFENVSSDTISSLQINGVGHIVTTLGDLIMDGYAAKEPFTFQNATAIYEKKFNKNSSAGYYLYQETRKFILDSVHACAIAEKLMREGAFEKAMIILEPFIFDVDLPNQPTNDALYNYAICLTYFNRNDEANNLHYKIIQQYIQLPSVVDMSNIKFGCTKQEALIEAKRNVQTKIEELDKSSEGNLK